MRSRVNDMLSRHPNDALYAAKQRPGFQSRNAGKATTQNSSEIVARVPSFQIQSFPGTKGSYFPDRDYRFTSLALTARVHVQAWGNAPGVLNAKISAESAFHQRIVESHLQRWPGNTNHLGLCPRLVSEMTPLATRRLRN